MYSEHQNILQTSESSQGSKFTMEKGTSGFKKIFYHKYFFFFVYLHSQKKTVEPSSWLKFRKLKCLFYFLVSVCSIAVGYLQHFLFIIASCILWQKESNPWSPWCPSKAPILALHLAFPKSPPFKWVWENLFLKQQFSSFSEPRGI